MSTVCPNGHTSEADDYCDICGSPIDAAAPPKSSLDLDPEPPPAPAATGEPADPGAVAATGLECPNCGTENTDGALFCEACGYDFTTGAMPRDPDAPGDPAESGVAPGEAVGAGDPAAAAAREGTKEVSGIPAGGGATAPGEPAAFEWLAEVWIDPDWYKTQEAEDPCPSPGLPVIMPLRHRSVLLGRVSTSRNTHPEIDLSSDPGVSRRHAQLTTDGTRWFVEDLGSSNGTFVSAAAGPLPTEPISVGPKTELDADDRLYVGAWTRVVVRRATDDEAETYG